MTFETATQATDLDRVDNIRAATDEAKSNRERYNGADVEAASLLAEAQLDNKAATLELIARHEARIRAVVSEFRVSNGAAETDLQQAALLGFLTALAEYDPTGTAEFFTFAHNHIRVELSEANRTTSAVPVAWAQHKRFFSAMRAADNDPAVARRWTQLQRGSIAELEVIAESDGEDAELAREIIDHRVDVYESHVRRGYVSTGRGRGDRKPVPEWEAYRHQSGRGLTGPEFDTIHGALTYESLDVPRGDADGDDDTAVPCDSLAEAAGSRPADPYADVDGQIAIDQLLSELDDREQHVIVRHLDGETDREIAAALGLSRTRVVNIRAEAVARMRKLSAA